MAAQAMRCHMRFLPQPWLLSAHLQEKGVGVTYKNLRLVSTRLDWEWVGEVHEFVHRKDDKHHSQEDIDGVWFHHDASGGQGGKRFARDEQLLRKVSSCGRGLVIQTISFRLVRG